MTANSSTVKRFGAIGDGVADDTAAVQEAVTFCVMNNLTLNVPPGTYVCAAPIVAFGTLHLFGSGVGNTVFHFPTNAGFVFTLSDQFHSVHLRDFRVLCGSAGPSNAAIRLCSTADAIPNPANTALSDICNVWICGGDCPAATYYWACGIDIENVSNVNLSNVTVTGSAAADGTGLWVHGNADLPPVVFNLTNCTFNYLTAGIEYGDYVQGVTITACNFTGCLLGVDAGSDLTGLDQLSVSNSQFNCEVAAISTCSFIPDFTFTGNVVFIPGPETKQAVGLNLVQAHRGAVIGNSFSGFNNHQKAYAVVVYANAGAGLIVVGNSFHALGAGVILQEASKGNNVQSNIYTDVAYPMINTGSDNMIGGGSR